jgi:hypothetical protein
VSIDVKGVVTGEGKENASDDERGKYGCHGCENAKTERHEPTRFDDEATLGHEAASSL